MSTAQKGFTLIELLIVIAILGVLAAGVVAAINPAKRLGQARDARRKTDIASIYNALQAYAITHNGTYPIQTLWIYSRAGPTWFQALIDSGDLKTIPVDPTNNQCCPWNPTPDYYSYAYMTDATGAKFDLVARLENTDDPDRCGIKNYLRYYGGSWCVAFGGAYSNQIYSKNQNQ